MDTVLFAEGSGVLEKALHTFEQPNLILHSLPNTFVAAESYLFSSPSAASDLYLTAEPPE